MFDQADDSGNVFLTHGVIWCDNEKCAFNFHAHRSCISYETNEISASSYQKL